MHHTKPSKPHSKTLGQAYEKVALAYLQQQGMHLMHQNFTSRFGEIDLIMKQKQVLVFIEVKFRSYNDFGSGLESITFRKQKKLITTAHHFLNRYRQHQELPCRFDVLAIKPKNPLSESELSDFHFDWIENAFDLGDCFSSL